MGVKRKKSRRPDRSQTATTPQHASMAGDPLAGTALPAEPADEPDAPRDETSHDRHDDGGPESLAAQCRFDDDEAPVDSDLSNHAMTEDAANISDEADEAHEAHEAHEAPESHVAPGCPDADQILAQEWPRRDVPQTSGARESRYQVLFQAGVLDAIHRHGKSNTEVELCGVLVGNMYHDGAAPYVLIEASIRGNAAVSKGTQVTFTSETWTRIHEALEKEHSDCRIVGWYHTHPGFGIFLSGMDLFIQDNFFNAPWQVAFVYDPIGGDEGVFVWRAGKSQREPHLIVEHEDDDAHDGWVHRGVDWLRGLFAS
jgi:proteasome lid subunit RPN8/RPN11